MTNLESVEQSVIKALEDLKANNESGMKGIKEISTKCNRPTVFVLNVINGMIKKNSVKSSKKDLHTYYYLQNKK